MNCFSRWRPSFSARELLAGVLSSLCAVSACAPTVDLGCKSDDDCAPGRTCAAGQCIGAPLADAAGGAISPPADAAGGGPTDARALRDAGVEDQGAGTDAATPDAAVSHCPLEPGAPIPMEQCNGVDDDCDGTADLDAQGLPLTEACAEGPPELAGVGVCAFGARICLDGSLGACVGASPPGQEICDGADNDCNGVEDDVEGGCAACEAGSTRSCYTGSPETLGVGDCQSGTQTCGEGAQGWGPCEGETRPESETCDAHDDDCNGEIDDVPGEGSACTVGTGSCVRQGHNICNIAVEGLMCDAAPGAPAMERCNGADDDCDGVTDEDLGLGTPCSAGVGTCQRIGVRICDAAGGVRCDAQAGMAVHETCDGLDNDCNAAVDDPGAEASCVGPSGTTPRCDAGQCHYSCAARAFDVDANPNDGCEHGCPAAISGAIVDHLNAPNDAAPQAGDFAIVTEPGGAAGVAYLLPTQGANPALRLFADGLYTNLSRSETGGYDAPSLAHIGGRWIAFAHHGPGIVPLASDHSLDGAVALVAGAAHEVDTQTWLRMSTTIPGVATLWAGERPTAVAFVVDPPLVPPGPYAGRLRTRVMNALDATQLADGLIGDEADYVANDARMLGFAYGNGTAVVAQFQSGGGYGLRFVAVAPGGNVTATANSPDGFPNASRDFAGALTDGGGTFALIDEDSGHLRYWRLTTAGNAPIFTGFDTQIDGVSSVSVVYGQGGPMIFVLQNNALRVLFLDAMHAIVGSLADVVVAPPGNSSIWRAHVASNGNRINAAWVVNLAGDLQLRMAQLECQ